MGFTFDLYEAEDKILQWKVTKQDRFLVQLFITNLQ
jgi:hypothetical protein